jgi:diketogulonate reductase-like aldo/keto reductase
MGCATSTWLLAICARLRPVDSLQTPLSMIRRDATLAEIPWCAEHGTGVLSYSPLQSGLLSGAFSTARMKRLAPDDWRRASPEFQPPRLGRNLALAHALRGIARRHHVKVAAWRRLGRSLARRHRMRSWAPAAAPDDGCRGDPRLSPRPGRHHHGHQAHQSRRGAGMP